MRLELPERKTLIYAMTIPIRWGDMDAMGHLNNVSYFRYMETCRIDWMRSAGCLTNADGQGPIIVNAFCNFYRELEYPGDVRIHMYGSDPARTTFETWVTMERVDAPGLIHAAGGATVIWVDMRAKKAIDLPDWVRELVG